MFKYLSIFLLVFVQIVDAKKSKTYFNYATQVNESIWIGSTPSQADIDDFKAKGINNVIFIGTEKELSKIKFDQAKVFKEQGIGFNWMAYGERKNKNLEALNKFNDLLLPNAGDKLVIYSRSYDRSRELVSAWLMYFMPTTVAGGLEMVESRVEFIDDEFMKLFASAD